MAGQYKMSDESASDNDMSKVNERCGGKENVVNVVSTRRSLFNLTGMQKNIKIKI